MPWMIAGRCQQPKADYNSHPYEHLQPAFSWKVMPEGRMRLLLDV